MGAQVLQKARTMLDQAACVARLGVPPTLHRRCEWTQHRFYSGRAVPAPVLAGVTELVRAPGLQRCRRSGRLGKDLLRAAANSTAPLVTPDGDDVMSAGATRIDHFRRQVAVLSGT